MKLVDVSSGMENNKKGLYYATITWSNFENGQDYSITINRQTYEYMVEDIQHYIEKYRPRKAKLETCAYESPTHAEVLTPKVKSELGL